MALIDFSDVKAGSEGGWLDDEAALSQAATAGYMMPIAFARVDDNARLTGTCVISHGATISDNACLIMLSKSRRQKSDNVTIKQSQIRGVCRIADQCVFSHCLVIAVRPTPILDKVLQIYQRATVSASIVHEQNLRRCREVEHALLNTVPKCSITHVLKVMKITMYGSVTTRPGLRSRAAGRRARRGSDPNPAPVQVGETPWSRATAQQKHRHGRRARSYLLGGPILLDDEVLIEGHTTIRGDVIIEHQGRNLQRLYRSAGG